MKVITLTQPWATLIAIGAKHIETRSWATKYRGPLAIHAGQGLGPVGNRRGMVRLCNTSPFYEALDAAGIWHTTAIDHLPYGAIVAVCELVDCIPTHHPGIASEPGKPWFIGGRKGVGQHCYEVPPRLDSNEYAFGDYTPGRWAWLLADVRALPEPIPAKGALSLWNYDLPDAVLNEV